MKLKHRLLFGLLAALAFAVVTLGHAAFAQDQKPTAPETPKEIVKAFPPARNLEFTQAQTELELAKARVVQAEQRIRLLLYAVADEIELTKVERETCPFALNPNGVWVFKCTQNVATAEKPKKPPEKPEIKKQ